MTSDKKEYLKQYYKKNKERLLQYKKENWEHIAAYQKEYRQKYYPAHKEERKAYYEKWRKIHWEELKQKIYKANDKNKKQISARNKVNNAIRLGKLVKQPCEVCGSLSAEAHHCDYNKPLDVNWLCKEHHMEWHENNEPIR